MEPRISVEFKSDFWTAPIALISVGVEKPNFYPTCLMGGPVSAPPMVTISLGHGPKRAEYSHQLLKEVGQFVVNFPTVEMVREIEYAGTYSGRDVNKWKKCGFTPIKGKVIDVPLIAECPVNLECIVVQEIRFRRDDGREASHALVIGRIVQLDCHEKYFINGHVQWDLIDLVFRAKPQTYRALGPVLGYDLVYHDEPPTDPRLAAAVINRRTAALVSLFEPDRERPDRAGVVNPHRRRAEV